jgi:hypothetical protein
MAMWSAGKLRDVDNAIKAVLQASQELDRHADSRSSNGSSTSLIVAFLKFMTLTCALWMEVASYIMRKARRCVRSPPAFPSFLWSVVS